MKDAYSFARNQDEHSEIYEKMATAYSRVYDRLGLGEITFRTKADGGYFTDRNSDEYQTLSALGEDTLYHVPDTDLWYNEEIAPAEAPKVKQGDVAEKSLENIKADGVIGVDELVKHLNVATELTTKTMIYQTDSGEIVAAAVRGGYDINEIKLRKVVGAKSLKLADAETIKRVTGAEIGYAGLLNLPDSVRIVVDESCADRVNFEMGNNVTGEHTINVNWGRDLNEPERYYDVKTAKAGDFHPESGKVYEVEKGVEVGNIFSLESKYPDALGLYYSDDNGEQQHIVMGCYGIGVSRLFGVIAEIFADDRGLIWPENLAPFKVCLIQIGDDETVKNAVEKLYKDLQKSGIEVLWDDRTTARPGEKFADADLMGIPHRVVISQKNLKTCHSELVSESQEKNEEILKLVQDDKNAKFIEYKSRKSGEAEMLTVDELFAKLGA
jgi:prolyl-tRNA synthetase